MSNRLATQAWCQRSRGQRGSKPLAVDSFNPPTNRRFRDKPFGGLWTSTFSEADGSDWVRWCVDNGFDGPTFNMWLLEVAPTAAVWQIDTARDLIALINRYPSDDSSDDWDYMGSYADWEAVAQDFDGVHLSKAGLKAVAFSCPGLPDWDCESTLWLRWSFTTVSHLGRRTFGEIQV